MRSVERAQRERERVSADEHARLNTFIGETIDEMNKRITQQELKLREEYDDKLSHLNKVHCYHCFRCCLCN